MLLFSPFRLFDINDIIFLGETLTFEYVSIMACCVSFARFSLGCLCVVLSLKPPTKENKKF